MNSDYKHIQNLGDSLDSSTIPGVSNTIEQASYT